MNILKYFSLKIHQADLTAPTKKMFRLLYKSQREIFVPIPLQKIRTVVGRDGGKGEKEPLQQTMQRRSQRREDEEGKRGSQCSSETKLLEKRHEEDDGEE